MMTSTIRLWIVGLLLVLASGCSKPSHETESIEAALGDVHASARNHAGYADITVGAGAHVRLDGVRISQLLLADFNGKRCLAVLTDGEEPVSLYEVREDDLRLMWSGLSQALKPWKIRIGDVDGDGSEDLMAGVYKKARFHPVMAKRPFIYSWNGKTMYPKWLGSRLSRPFTDFTLADFGSGVRVVAVEETKDGANELAVYKWDGFGVTGEWSGARSDRLSGLEVLGSLGKHSVWVRSGSSTRVYVWKDNSLQLKEAPQ